MSLRFFGRKGTKKESDSFQDGLNQSAQRVLIAGVHVFGHAAGDDAADRHRPVSHQGCQSGERRALHLEVGDFPSVPLECLYLPVQIRVGQRQAQFPPLRTVESVGGNRRAPQDVVPADLLEERRVCRDNVWLHPCYLPVQLPDKFLLHRCITYFLAVCVEIQYPVEADGMLGGDVGPDRREGLQSAARAQADEGQLAEVGPDGARRKVDVCQRIQLRQHDVDIVAADAVRDDAEAFAPERAGYGVKFAAADVAFRRVEISSDGGYALRVADEEDTVGQLFRLDMEVECAAVGVDDEFG